ncbi:MAG: hypothetical protein BWZ10_01718 [candidate division BRC1 bacterium ADurb.BinA364]|nr:MAG: hypothetical protein BWZ10_01718 [candidate division BRC1 bacterium ADurb.BinA364]
MALARRRSGAWRVRRFRQGRFRAIPRIRRAASTRNASRGICCRQAIPLSSQRKSSLRQAESPAKRAPPGARPRRGRNAAAVFRREPARFRRPFLPRRRSPAPGAPPAGRCQAAKGPIEIRARLRESPTAPARAPPARDCARRSRLPKSPASRSLRSAAAAIRPAVPCAAARDAVREAARSAIRAWDELRRKNAPIREPRGSERRRAATASAPAPGPLRRRPGIRAAGATFPIPDSERPG